MYELPTGTHYCQISKQVEILPKCECSCDTDDDKWDRAFQQHAEIVERLANEAV